eukprot:scaffold292465_cov37-Attheya_sp.AAC.1
MFTHKTGSLNTGCSPDRPSVFFEGQTVNFFRCAFREKRNRRFSLWQFTIFASGRQWLSQRKRCRRLGYTRLARANHMAGIG